MNDKAIWDYLIDIGLSPYGAAGLMGNLYAESALNPQNLQNSSEKRLGMSDKEYTTAVDNGSYRNFVRDSAGYGLAQWTYWSRKEKLLNYAKGRGVSIGDLNMQLDFLCAELKGYKSVWNTLHAAASVKMASDVILTEYEKPADQSEAAKQKRAQYGQRFYDQYASKKSETEVITEQQARQKLVDIAVSWMGCNGADGSHKKIIDIYNNHKPLARGYTVKYTDSWCATYCSSAAIVAGYTDIIPTECGCGQLIALFQDMKRWVENDAYVPSPGDYIFYDWSDGTNYAKIDNTDWPDHVGIVASVSGNVIKVAEGNKKDAVGYRELIINGRYIRGYGVPDYASVAGAAALPSPSLPHPGNLCMTPRWIGKVKASILNVRKWAGTEYKKLQSRPQLAAGEQVEICDSVTARDGSTWYYIRIDGHIYGFAHSDYIEKAGEGAGTIKAGMEVTFTGITHYTNSGTRANGKSCRPGVARVTAVNPNGAHPYHLVRTPNSGSTVYGWVNAADVAPR